MDDMFGGALFHVDKSKDKEVQTDKEEPIISEDMFRSVDYRSPDKFLSNDSSR